MPRYLTQWLKDNAGLLVLLLVVFAIYATGFSGQLVVDDTSILKDNPYLDRATIARIFSSGFWDNVINQDKATAMYRPLVMVYFWSLHKLFGIKPLGYHIILTLVHLANICLVYAVARRVFVTSTMAATIGAAIFALHPTRVESVAWISGIPDPLTTFFLLAAFLAHHVFSENPKNVGYLVLAACCFQLALWSKEVAAIFPLVVLSIDLILRRRTNRTAMIFYLVLLGGYLAARSAILGDTGQLANMNFSNLSRVIDLTVGYASMLAFPVQVPFYMQPPLQPVSSTAGWCAIVLLAAGAAFAWRIFDTGGKRLLASSVIWTIGFSWTAILMMFYLEGFYSARFLYVPLTGLAFLAALIFDRLTALHAGLKVPVMLFSAFAIVAYAIVTLRGIPMWHDEVKVYQGVVEAEPKGTIGFLDLGFAFVDKGDFAEAEENFQIALRNARIPRVKAQALVALGTIAGMSKDVPRSARYLNEAVQVDPGNSMAWTGLGNLAWISGQLQQSIPLYEKALALRSDNYEAAMNLASVYDQIGQTGKAESIRKAILK